MQVMVLLWNIVLNGEYKSRFDVLLQNVLNRPNVLDTSFLLQN